jgi:hypothetical protein
MNTKYSIHLFQTSFVVFILFSETLYANTHKIAQSDFTLLCEIYNQANNASVDLTTKEMTLTEKVYNELPVLFNQLFTYVMRTNADERYALINQYTRQEYDSDWKCESARLYYLNSFK